MKKTLIIIGIIVLVGAGAGFLMWQKNTKPVASNPSASNSTIGTSNPAPIIKSPGVQELERQIAEKEKEIDEIEKQISESEQAAKHKIEPAKPEIYEETFEQPINAKLDSDRHKAVYWKIREMVTFPVLIPMSNEYELMSVHVSKTLGGDDVGAFNTFYKTRNGSIEYYAYKGDGPSGPDVFPEKVILKNGGIAYFLVTYDQKDERPLNLFWFSFYTIRSKDLSREELTNFANSLVEPE